MKCEFTPFVLKKEILAIVKMEELCIPFPDTVAVVLNLDQPELPSKRSKNLGMNLIPGTTKKGQRIWGMNLISGTSN